jgi:hypothetical protein
MNKRDIKKICRKYGIENYTINDDLSIDVNESVHLNNKDLTKLPLKFNKIMGSFYCDGNKLQTLKGSPVYIDGYFDCGNNKLSDLKYGPNYVGGYYRCNFNPIKNYDYFPDYLGNDFVYHNDELNIAYKQYLINKNRSKLLKQLLHE